MKAEWIIAQTKDKAVAVSLEQADGGSAPTAAFVARDGQVPW